MRGEFGPPYLNTVVPTEAMLETQILCPLETKYYYSKVEGTLEVREDGTFELLATTERLGEIKIRGEDDFQVYTRELEASGTIDFATLSGAITGTVTGTDVLWSTDSDPTTIATEVQGQLIVQCDATAPSGIAIHGNVAGQGYIEFIIQP